MRKNRQMPEQITFINISNAPDLNDHQVIVPVELSKTMLDFIVHVCGNKLATTVTSKLTFTYKQALLENKYGNDKSSNLSETNEDDDEIYFIVPLLRQELSKLINDLLPYANRATRYDTKRAAEATVIHLTDFYENAAIALH